MVCTTSADIDLNKNYETFEIVDVFLKVVSCLQHETEAIAGITKSRKLLS